MPTIYYSLIKLSSFASSFIDIKFINLLLFALFSPYTKRKLICIHTLYERLSQLKFIIFSCIFVCCCVNVSLLERTGWMFSYIFVDMKNKGFIAIEYPLFVIEKRKIHFIWVQKFIKPFKAFTSITTSNREVSEIDIEIFKIHTKRLVINCQSIMQCL